MKMKKFFIYATLMAVMISAFACNQTKQMNNQNQKQSFGTPEEAAKKGRDDLLTVARQHKEINTGIDTAALEKATAGKVIRQAVLSFDKLLSADTTRDMNTIVQEESNQAVPFINGNEVITIVEVKKSGKGWEVAALGNKQLSDDLTALGITGDSLNNVTVYEVPNLKTKVYGVRKGDNELFYTNYKNVLSLRQGVSASVVLSILKKDAIEFQRKFGDSLKKGKLVE